MSFASNKVAAEIRVVAGYAIATQNYWTNSLQSGLPVGSELLFSRSVNVRRRVRRNGTSTPLHAGEPQNGFRSTRGSTTLHLLITCM